jgi:hypothetical protein
VLVAEGHALGSPHTRPIFSDEAEGEGEVGSGDAVVESAAQRLLGSVEAVIGFTIFKPYPRHWSVS